MDRPLVIAGAGIAGLALAAGLQRTDTTPYVLLDERPELGSAGGAITLWPNAMVALEEIGVADDVRREGQPLSAGTIRDRRGRVLRQFDPDRSVAALGGPLVAVRRGALIEILHSRVKADSVRLGCAVRGYRHDHQGVQVLTDGDPVAAAALVGADGYRSEVARALHPGLRETYAGYPAWRGIADSTGGLEPVQLWGSHQEFGVVPLSGEAAYWFATVREPPGGVVDDELAHLRTAFAGWPEPVQRVLDATDPTAVTRNDVMDRALPRRWADGPVVVMGDAAHSMRPHLGQGGCQALVDAAVLSRMLATADAPAAFAAFEDLRRGPTRRVVALSRNAGRAINSPDVLHRLSRLLPDALMLRNLARVGGTGAYPW